MSDDEERAAIGTAEQYIERSFGHVDLSNHLSGRVVDEDLSVRDVDVAGSNTYEASGNET